MTPKRFFTETGLPFPYTVLDDRAGLLHERGCYLMAENGESVPTLSAEAFARVRAYAEEGERRLAARDFDGAIRQFVEALMPLPIPTRQWNAAGWLVVAIAEACIQAGDFAGAEEPLMDAMWCPGTLGNPWVHLRYGQMRYELGNLHRAADELCRAYMGGGREIFEGQDPKYFAFLEQILLQPGQDRLP